jgi:predicted amidophosphoribosyltransferase
MALELDSSVLVRTRFTETQTGLTREQRQANIHGAFRAGHCNVAGRDILLVDDVFTTGTTVSECARVLKRAGAASVYVATVARVVRTESISSAWTEGKQRDENLAMGSASGRS